MTDSDASFENDSPRKCEGCDAFDVPLRSIMMQSGGRQLLCEDCFLKKLGDGQVDPRDPRVETRGGPRV